jgi:hypothetical protein
MGKKPVEVNLEKLFQDSENFHGKEVSLKEVVIERRAESVPSYTEAGSASIYVVLGQGNKKILGGAYSDARAIISLSDIGDKIDIPKAEFYASQNGRMLKLLDARNSKLGI